MSEPTSTEPKKDLWGHIKAADEKILETRAGTQASVTVGATAIISVGAVLLEKHFPHQIEQVKEFFYKTIKNAMNPIDALAEKLSGHKKSEEDIEKRNRKWGNLAWDSGVISLLGALWIIPTHMRSHHYARIREDMKPDLDFGNPQRLDNHTTFIPYSLGKTHEEAEKAENDRFKREWKRDILEQFIAFTAGTVGGTWFLNFTRNNIKPDAPDQLVKSADEQQSTEKEQDTAGRTASWIANNLVFTVGAVAANEAVQTLRTKLEKKREEEAGKSPAH